MNILHLISLTFTSGSEHFVVDLANQQVKLGHNVYIVADNLTLFTTAKFISQPITDRSIKFRKLNLAFLKDFVQENNIQIVHCHSRSSNWLAHYALKKLMVAHLTSYHCRQGIHFSTKHIDTSGSFALPVCENVGIHINKDLNIPKNKINLLPNCINFNVLDKKKKQLVKSDLKQIAIIGRTNSEKGLRCGEFIIEFGEYLLINFPDYIIKIIGGSFSKLNEKAKLEIERLNLKYNNRVVEIIYSNNLTQEILNSDLIIGAGRVAIECLYMEKPLISMGEKLFHGLINENNFQEALNSNFGDTHLLGQVFEWDSEKVKEEMNSILKGLIEIQTIKNQILDRFNLEEIANKSLEFYRSAILKKINQKHIPILMYHKITLEPIETKHQTFISKENFILHLKFLKSNKFTSITFQDIEKYINGEIDLTKFPKKPIILTFDDGYKNNFDNLLPLMKEYNFKAVIYLLGDTNVTYNYWDADYGDHRDELMNNSERKSFAEAGWEIGAHTNTHRNLTELSLKELTDEINISKSKIEEELNIKVISFAYPTGLYNNQIVEELKKSGIKYGIATDTGGLRIYDDFFRIFRASIFPNDKWFEIRKKTSTWYRDYYFKKRGK